MKSHPLLDQAGKYGVRLGLERVCALLERLGQPQRTYHTLHVAGTNGKGSTSTMISSALSESGYLVGTYLSPHLVHINERFRIAEQPVDDDCLDVALATVNEARQQMGVDDPLTWFELSTLAAFCIFQQRGVDIAVIEVGLGGRLDATRVVLPLGTAITSIGLDHTDVLGNTLSSIAREKVAIAQPGVPLVTSVSDAAALMAIRAYTRSIAAPLWALGGALTVIRRAGNYTIQTPYDVVDGITLAMQGAHQVSNAVTAVGMLHSAAHAGLTIPRDAVVRGLASARLRGRFEQVAPQLWIDGAHNAQGAMALAETLSTAGDASRRILVIGVNAPRDPLEILKPLAPCFHEVITTQSSHACAHSTGRVAMAARTLWTSVREIPNPIKAVEAARQAGDEVVVAGSLYLIGDVLDAVSSG